MIIEVNEENLYKAAEIHSITWIDSHREICSDEFLNLHTPYHQADYIKQKMKDDSKFYLFMANADINSARGIVSIRADLIEDLYVLPEFQNKGIGTELLKFAEGKCKGNPELWILSTNKSALRLYERHGYRTTGKINRLTEEIFETELKKIR